MNNEIEFTVKVNIDKKGIPHFEITKSSRKWADLDDKLKMSLIKRYNLYGEEFPK